jgi:hypothetical protein
MTTLATITVTAPSVQLSTRAQEVGLIARGLELAAQSIRGAGGAVTSGNIVDTGSNVIGSWTYAPEASS